MKREEILAKVDPNGYFKKEDTPRIYDELMKLPEEGRMLEIGTGRGDSATFFARVKPKWIIYTVDAYGAGVTYKGGYNINDLYKKVCAWKKQGLTNIVPIIADFVMLPWELEVDFLYIDGAHTYDAVKNDFEHFTPFLKKGGFVLMDDYKPRTKDRFEVYKYLEEVKDEWDIEPLNWLVIVRRKNDV